MRTRTERTWLVGGGIALVAFLGLLLLRQGSTGWADARCWQGLEDRALARGLLCDPRSTCVQQYAPAALRDNNANPLRACVVAAVALQLPAWYWLAVVAGLIGAWAGPALTARPRQRPAAAAPPRG